MRLLRALARHLDPWAALVLGLLVAMAVIILLATAAHLRRGAGTAPAAVPPALSRADVAAFLMTGGPIAQCQAAFWIHLDPSTPSLSVVVVPPQALGFLPGGGYEPLGEIVRDAGPAAGAVALGGMVGVPMHLWVTAGMAAIYSAFPQSFPGTLSSVAALRMRDSILAWSSTATPAAQFARQYSFLRLALPEGGYAGLNVIAFADYVLAAPGMAGNLDLQTAASAAAIMRRLVDTPPVAVALPAINQVTRGSQSWTLETGPLLSVRQSLALGVPLPDYGARVTVRRAAARVVVLLDPLGSAQRPYLAALSRRLRESSGGTVGLVPLVLGRADDAGARLTRVLDQVQPQAVLVALGWRATASDDAGLATRLAAVTTLLRERGQAAVLAAPPTESAGAAQVVATAAGHAELPLSPAPPAALPTSAAPVAEARVVRLVDAWASAQVATLVRACDPLLFAPRLPGTLAGVSYYQRTKATVLMADSSVLARYQYVLTTCGWHASTGAVGAWKPLLAGTAVSFRPGAQPLARALAGDLGLSTAALVVDPRAPATLVVTGP